MTRLEAHALLFDREDRSIVPFPATLSGPGGTVDGWAALATALAEASGWLDDCATEAELEEAIRQGQALVDSDVVSAADIGARAMAVVQEVLVDGAVRDLIAREEERKQCWRNN
jgi:hypothetical protein